MVVPRLCVAGARERHAETPVALGTVAKPALKAALAFAYSGETRRAAISELACPCVIIVSADM